MDYSKCVVCIKWFYLVCGATHLTKETHVRITIGRNRIEINWCVSCRCICASIAVASTTGVLVACARTCGFRNSANFIILFVVNTFVVRNNSIGYLLRPSVVAPPKRRRERGTNEPDKSKKREKEEKYEWTGGGMSNKSDTNNSNFNSD